MRIKDEAQFAIGIIIILMAITCTIIWVVQCNINIGVFLLDSIIFVCGTLSILSSIEINAQRQNCKTELQTTNKTLEQDMDSDAK